MITWYTQSWTRKDQLKSFWRTLSPMILNLIYIMVAAGLVAYVSTIFNALIIGSVLLVLAVIVFLIKIKGQRAFSPLAIGLDDELLYLDLSMFKEGSIIETIQIQDVRRLTLMLAPPSFPEGNTLENTALLNISLNGLTIPILVGLDFQDRRRKIMQRSIGINPRLENVDGLIDRLANLPAIAHRVRNVGMGREEFLTYYREAIDYGLPESFGKNTSFFSRVLNGKINSAHHNGLAG